MKLKKHLLAARALTARLAAAAGVAVDLRDRFFFGGLAMLGYGAHSIYPPAGWISVGTVLFLVGLRGR